MKKLNFFADFFTRAGGPFANGGAELDNEHFLLWLESQGIRPHLKRCPDVTLADIKEGESYMVANFTGLNPEVKLKMADIGNYVIWEHDHKYSPTRDVSQFEDFLVPVGQRINVFFYNKAKQVWGFTKRHCEIISKNTGTPAFSLGTSFWSQEQFEIIEGSRFLRKSKGITDEYAVLLSTNPIKNTVGTIAKAKELGLPYNTIGEMPRNDFIRELSRHSGLVFFPKCFETFSRVVAEALMLDLKVVLDENLVGLTGEDWYGNLTGFELACHLRETQAKAREKLLESLA